jgi:hypothetical protein
MFPGDLAGNQPRTLIEFRNQADYPVGFIRIKLLTAEKDETLEVWPVKGRLADIGQQGNSVFLRTWQGASPIQPERIEHQHGLH